MHPTGMEETREHRFGHTSHELKTWPPAFSAILDGQKTHEVRVNDRHFQVGDNLRLREWNPETECYTGRYIVAAITYITEGGTFGLPPELIVMSIAIQYFDLGDNSRNDA